MKKLLLSLALALGVIAGSAGMADAAKTFGGGSPPSRSSPPPSRPVPARSRPTPPPSSPSGPVSTPSPRPVTPPPAPVKAKTNYDQGAARSAKVDSSRRDYEAVRSKPVSSYQPKPTYTSASGQSRPINASDPRVVSIRNNYSYSIYETRTTRYTTVFGPSYTSYHTTVLYSDPINPFFYGYLMGRMTTHDRAVWVYHHRDELDEARYREMCAKDAKLQAEIDLLKAQNVAKNPAYTPTGVDPDLQYTDEYVKAATGVDQAEQEVKAAEARLRDAQRDRDRVEGRSSSHFSFVGFLWGCVKVVFFTVVFVGIVWVGVTLIRYMLQ